MPNVKISALPAATTPLTGPEEIPLVQGGTTKRVTVTNLFSDVTAARIANSLGAVGAPSYTFTGDTNTGMWSPAADTIAFSEGGVEVMRITSAGNVGVGTTTPAEKFTVAGRIRSSVGGGTIDVWHDGTNGSVAASSQLLLYANGASDMIFHTNSNQRMRIMGAGNVGIGTNAPNAAALLDVTSTTSGFLPPRMTTAQRDAIVSPPDGLVLYNSTTNKLQVRAASAWVDLH